MPAGVNAVLARYRTISVAALSVLMGVTWAWVLAGAGMSAGPQFSLAPATADETVMAGMAMGAPAPWPFGHYVVIFSMWWTMMVAMMLPSAAPTILLYGRVVVSTQVRGKPAVSGFLSGYLFTWSLFSIIATLMQRLLERQDLIAPATMASQSPKLSGAILIAAGLYQLGPFKNACLRHCQSPSRFLTRHYRAGPLGSFRMGALHGAICIGCCWPLMALLFVGGVMNVAWIALLTLMVAAEKLLPFGRAISVALGLACLAGGGLMLLL